MISDEIASENKLKKIKIQQKNIDNKIIKKEEIDIDGGN